MPNIKFKCTHCHMEVTAEYYSNPNIIGFYAECPECETENEVFPKEEKKEMDSWVEDERGEVENGLSSPQS